MKKFLALCMAVAMVASLGIGTAFAETGEPADDTAVDTSLVDSVDAEVQGDIMPINADDEDAAPVADPVDADDEAAADAADADVSDEEPAQDTQELAEPDPVADSSQIVSMNHGPSSSTIRLAIIGLILIAAGGGALLYANAKKKKK